MELLQRVSQRDPLGGTQQIGAGILSPLGRSPQAQPAVGGYGSGFNAAYNSTGVAENLGTGLTVEAMEQLGVGADTLQLLSTVRNRLAKDVRVVSFLNPLRNY